MNPSLEYLADTIVIESLAKDDPLFIVAQSGGVMTSVANGVKSYVESVFDKDRPIASIASIMGRGLLWSMGFKWMAILYTVAEALGFDWKGFWTSVGQSMTEFFQALKGTQPTEAQATGKINSAVSNAFQNSFSNKVDKQKLMDMAKRYNTTTASYRTEALELKALAVKYNNSSELIKNAGGISILKGKLFRFFLKTISWLVKTALVSAGLITAAGATKGLFHATDKGESTEQDQGSQRESGGYGREIPSKVLQVSPNVSPDMYSVHRNNMSSVWIERGNIENVDDLLVSWVLSAYPQLSKYENEIKNSSGFRSMISRFNDRNRLAGGLDLISVPRPFQRKMDVVSTIVNGFLRENAA